MKQKLYKGKIYICTGYEEKKLTDGDISVYEQILYFDKDKFVRVERTVDKKDAYLLRIRKNIYVDIDDIQNLTNLFDVLFKTESQDYINLIYSFPKGENDLFVRKQELKPLYVDKDKIKKEVLKKIKK